MMAKCVDGDRIGFSTARPPGLLSKIKKLSHFFRFEIFFSKFQSFRKIKIKERELWMQTRFRGEAE
jgi:hypothetical protein